MNENQQEGCSTAGSGRYSNPLYANRRIPFNCKPCAGIIHTTAIKVIKYYTNCRLPMIRGEYKLIEDHFSGESIADRPYTTKLRHSMKYAQSQMATGNMADCCTFCECFQKKI